MRPDRNMPDDDIRSIGRELRLTGDLVYVGGFPPPDDDADAPTALFFARLFSTMQDDGCGVFIEPRTLDGSKVIVDHRIFDEQERVVGYVVDEMTEGDVPRTLFCAVMLRAATTSDVMHILRTSVLWPMLSAIDARCSACGRSYNYRMPFSWCQHIASGRKQAIVDAKVRRLVLTENRIRQTLMEMFNVQDTFPDIALDPIGGSEAVIQIIGGEVGEPIITFAVGSGVGYESLHVGEHRLRPGQRIAIPMSMIGGLVEWRLLSSSLLVPIDHEGSVAYYGISPVVPTDAEDD